MSYWQDHIAQLKALLQNFQQEIAPYWDKESQKEKKSTVSVHREDNCQYIEK